MGFLGYGSRQQCKRRMLRTAHRVTNCAAEMPLWAVGVAAAHYVLLDCQTCWDTLTRCFRPFIVTEQERQLASEEPNQAAVWSEHALSMLKEGKNIPAGK